MNNTSSSPQHQLLDATSYKRLFFFWKHRRTIPISSLLKRTMGKPWLSLSEQQLDELSLDEEASSEGQQQPSSRPQCLSGPAHEILLVLVAAFTGASFLLLQRATMVLTDTIRHSLQLDMSDMSWMSASSGYVLCIVWVPNAIYKFVSNFGVPSV